MQYDCLVPIIAMSLPLSFMIIGILTCRKYIFPAYQQKTIIDRDGYYCVLWIHFMTSDGIHIVNDDLRHPYQCMTIQKCLYLKKLEHKFMFKGESKRVFDLANKAYPKSAFNIGLSTECLYLKKGEEFEHVYKKFRT